MATKRIRSLVGQVHVDIAASTNLTTPKCRAWSPSLKAHARAAHCYPVFLPQWLLATRLDRDRSDWTPTRICVEGSYHTSYRFGQKRRAAWTLPARIQRWVNPHHQVAIIFLDLPKKLEFDQTFVM